MRRGSRRELHDLIIACISLALCFSVDTVFYRLSAFPLKFLLSLLLIGSNFIAHELAHKFVAQGLGYWAEFRLWIPGAILALLFALVSQGRFFFAAVGAVYIVPPLTSFYWDYGERTRDNGLIALAGPLTNMVLAVLFFVLAMLGILPGWVGRMGYILGLFLAGFNLIPFPPLDGLKVFSWNPLIWALLFVPVWMGIVLY